MSSGASGNVQSVGLLDASDLDRLADELAAHGFAVVYDWLPTDLIVALELEALTLGAVDREDAVPGTVAGIGRAAGRTEGGAIRRSRTRWLDGGTPAQAQFLAIAEGLRHGLNARLFLGLFEFEAQLALYEPGGFYVRHRDSLAGARNRIVSLVAYFNRSWPVDAGGELVIWRRDDDPTPRVVRPKAGTLVLMLSEDILHEARPALQRRTSIAGWFRVNTSRADRIDPPR